MDRNNSETRWRFGRFRAARPPCPIGICRSVLLASVTGLSYSANHAVIRRLDNARRTYLHPPSTGRNPSMQIKHLTGPALALTAFLPATALADGGAAAEIEMLKRENAQMKEMMMRMQEQLQNVMIQTKAMQQQADKDKQGKGKKGMVKSKKENITIATTGGGIKVKSSNGNKFKIGGRLMFDHDSYDKFWNGDGDGSAEENEIRRSRITLAGNSGKHWSYKFTANIDHEDETSSVDTGYLQYKSKPMYVKVGKYKRPGMLEERTSSKWLSTIERSILNEMADAALGKPSFGGVEVGFATKGDMPISGALGIYDDEDEDGEGGDEYGIGARISTAPKFGGGAFLHAGASYYNVDYAGNDYRVRSRLGMHTTGRPFETQKFKTDDIDQMGLELAYVSGPFSLQGEYMSVESDAAGGARIDRDGEDVTARRSDVDMTGYYMQATYTLTGETRGYKASSGAFKAIKPKGEMGAWELVVRYEDADVDVKAFGEEASVERMVLGVNWYATKNVKMMLNYVDAEAKDCKRGTENGNHAFKRCGYNGKDNGDGYSLRAQYVF